MLNRFFSLRHNTIVCGNNQYNNIRCCSTTCTHGRKGGVSGCIQERNLTAVGFYTVGTNVLGNTTRFTGRHFGATNVVKQ